MILDFDEDAFAKCQTGKFTNARLIGDILISLGVVPEGPQWPGCNSSLKTNLDSSKSIPIRYWCGKCSKRNDSRRFSVFTFTRISAVEILQIISLFVDGHGTTEIVSKGVSSVAKVQRIINFIRERIKDYVDSTSTSLGNNSVVEIDETLIAKKENITVEGLFLNNGYLE